ncbi:hypothetical protein CRUP_019120 [Coryphaenoides rupestris]|nr:hypothetical protein CRUP_019120 [Coryphaenoides rupestris]
MEAMTCDHETHQAGGVLELGEGLVTPLLGLQDPGQGPAVGPLAEPGGQGPQTLVVAGLPLDTVGLWPTLGLCTPPPGEKQTAGLPMMGIAVVTATEVMARTPCSAAWHTERR